MKGLSTGEDCRQDTTTSKESGVNALITGPQQRRDPFAIRVPDSVRFACLLSFDEAFHVGLLAFAEVHRRSLVLENPALTNGANLRLPIASLFPQKDSVPAFWRNTILLSAKAAYDGDHTLEEQENPLFPSRTSAFDSRV